TKKQVFLPPGIDPYAVVDQMGTHTLAIAPSGLFAYVSMGGLVGESGDWANPPFQIELFTVDPKTGQFGVPTSSPQGWSVVPSTNTVLPCLDGTPEVDMTQVVIDASGQFLFVTDDEALTVFRLDPNTQDVITSSTITLPTLLDYPRDSVGGYLISEQVT